MPDLKSFSFDPVHELYDSNSADAIIWQLSGMARAGIQFAVSSWWGQHDYTDNAFENILLNVMKRSDNPHPSLKWAIYYEKEGYKKDLSLPEMISDLNYISQKYGREQAFLQIDGKIVIFVYATSDTDSSYIQRWAKAKELSNVYVVLKVIKGYKSYENLVDSWHQYAPANRFSVHEPHSAFVSPGFWKYDEPPRLARDVTQFKDSVRQMKATNVQFWLVETWNEYHEGTQIEPAKQIEHDDSKPPFKVCPGRASYGEDFIEALSS